MNKRNFSFLVVAMLTMMFFSCSKTENGNVEYIPFQETADGQWGMISLDGKVLFKEEFKNKPTIVRDGRFFVRTKDGVWEMYDATEKPRKSVVTMLTHQAFAMAKLSLLSRISRCPSSTQMEEWPRISIRLTENW